MNINVAYFFNYTISSFKEDLINSLPNRKNIFVIASVALGCLIAAYAAMRYCSLKIKKENEEELADIHENNPNILEDEIKTKNINEFQTVLDYSTNLSVLSYFATIQSAKCFVKIEFEHGEIKKEFIIKNLTNAPVDEAFMTQQANKIRHYIEDEMKESFGMVKQIQVMTLFKDQQNRFHQQFHDARNLNLGPNFSKRGSVIKHDMPHTIAEISYKCIIDQMNFPQEQQIQDEEFTPGTFYQVLNDSDTQNDLDTQPSNQSDIQAEKSKAQINNINIKVTIPPEIKTTLDSLFEGSPYSIDNLPVYPIILDKEKHGVPKRKNMTAPIMKGTSDDGRPFIIMKVDCNLRDEDIEEHVLEEEQDYYKAHRQLKDVLILFQYKTTDPLMWDQFDRNRSLDPSFFTRNFTDAKDGTGPTNSQQDNFKLVHTLLKTGESPDTNGLIWRISST